MGVVTVVDLVEVVYSAGKVFDGLSVSRLDTENFLRSGCLNGVASRADRALLEDLRDAAQFIVGHADCEIDAQLVRSINATITRSGALFPGKLRTQDQSIGVETPHGRHTPDAVTEEDLQDILDRATDDGDIQECAINLFVDLAKAQPFEDANKRTAVFLANSLLIGANSGMLLTIPVDDNDPAVAGSFSDLLARAYIYGEDDGIGAFLRNQGLTAFRRQGL